MTGKNLVRSGAGSVIFVLSLILVLLLATACQSGGTEEPVDPGGGAVATAEPPAAQAPTQAPPGPTATNFPGDPTEVLGKPNGMDTFDNSNNWTLFNNECFKSEITGGKFLMTAKGVPQFSCWERTWPEVENVFIQTLVEMPETCKPEDRFGLVFRMPDNDSGYQYGISCGGQYLLTSYDGQNTQTIVPLTGDEAIKTGPGEVNRLGVLANGSALDLYVNGVLLIEVSDNRFLEAGFLGYYIRAEKEDEGFMAIFDDLAVWLLE